MNIPINMIQSPVSPIDFQYMSSRPDTKNKEEEIKNIVNDINNHNKQRTIINSRKWQRPIKYQPSPRNLGGFTQQA